jgi:predicted Rossmann fold nucleotide-binding protein DprA/Smf involved in DNA uptake
MIRKNFGITGHQVIPSEAIPFLKKGMADVIANTREEIVCVSSLAAGADQLFAKAVLQAGGHLHAVIPCKNYEKAFSGKAQITQFRKLLSKAEETEMLEYESPSEEAFLKAGFLVVDLSDTLLAIWDGKKAKGKGGTADIVSYAERQNKEVILIWPEGVER